MIERILPPYVAAVEAWGDPPDAELFLGEEAIVAGALGERRREFTTVRHCARQALAMLGHPPVPILPGKDRDPQWTPGIVGSMTHCIGYRAAAVAHAHQAAALGIDAEPHQPLPEGLSRLIVRPDEQRRIAELTAVRPDVHWDRLTFSAKESVYKAWFPVVRCWLGFDDASLTFEPGSRRFIAELHRPGLSVAGQPLSRLSGEWLVADGIVVTAVVLPPHQ
jgi:4'-phosphopantetheinyl transferase EntD